MSKELSPFLYTYIIMMVLADLGSPLVYWSTAIRWLKGTDEILSIRNRDRFMQTMSYFLNAKLSKNPFYSAYPPSNNLELYEYYKKWEHQFETTQWRLAFTIISLQLGLGLWVAYIYATLGKELFFVIACTLFAFLISFLLFWRINKRTIVLRIIDKRFLEMTTQDRAALAASSQEQRYQQEYRLSAITRFLFP